MTKREMSAGKGEATKLLKEIVLGELQSFYTKSGKSITAPCSQEEVWTLVSEAVEARERVRAENLVRGQSRTKASSNSQNSSQMIAGVQVLSKHKRETNRTFKKFTGDATLTVECCSVDDVLQSKCSTKVIDTSFLLESSGVMSLIRQSDVNSLKQMSCDGDHLVLEFYEWLRVLLVNSRERAEVINSCVLSSVLRDFVSACQSGKYKLDGLAEIGKLFLNYLCTVY